MNQKEKIDIRDHYTVGQQVKCNTFGGRIGTVYKVYKRGIKIKLKDCSLKIVTTDVQEFFDKNFVEIV